MGHVPGALLGLVKDHLSTSSDFLPRMALLEGGRALSDIALTTYLLCICYEPNALFALCT